MSAGNPAVSYMSARIEKVISLRCLLLGIALGSGSIFWTMFWIGTILVFD